MESGSVNYRPRQNVTIRLNIDEVAAIDRLAAADGRSRSSFVRRLVGRAIQNSLPRTTKE